MRSPRAWLLSSLFLAACGGGDDSSDDDTTPPVDGATSDAPAPDASTPDGPSGAFTLTSTALTEGGMFESQYTCDGDNISPPLAWTGGPAAQSYAMVFRDNNNQLEHSAIWDIPPSVHELPEAVERAAQPDVPAGSKQARAYDGDPGYAGPCPGGNLHTYVFTVHAIDVATMPDITTSQYADDDDLLAAIAAHSIATATLSAKSDAGGE